MLSNRRLNSWTSPLELGTQRLQLADQGLVTQRFREVVRSVGIATDLYSANHLSRTASWTHNLRVSKCRTLPIADRLAIDLAADESVVTRNATPRPKSSARALAPMTSAAAFAKATYSDSADDKAESSGSNSSA